MCEDKEHPVSEMHRDQEHPFSEVRGDMEYPFSEVRGDKERPFSEVHGDKEHPFSEVRGDKEHPFSKACENECPFCEARVERRSAPSVRCVCGDKDGVTNYGTICRNDVVFCLPIISSLSFFFSFSFIR